MKSRKEIGSGNVVIGKGKMWERVDRPRKSKRKNLGHKSPSEKPKKKRAQKKKKGVSISVGGWEANSERGKKISKNARCPKRVHGYHLRKRKYHGKVISEKRSLKKKSEKKK